MIKAQSPDNSPKPGKKNRAVHRQIAVPTSNLDWKRVASMNGVPRRSMFDYR